jgi:hypothetical protein
MKVFIVLLMSLFLIQAQARTKSLELNKTQIRVSNFSKKFSSFSKKRKIKILSRTLSKLEVMERMIDGNANVSELSKEIDPEVEMSAAEMINIEESEKDKTSKEKFSIFLIAAQAEVARELEKLTNGTREPASCTSLLVTSAILLAGGVTVFQITAPVGWIGVYGGAPIIAISFFTAVAGGVGAFIWFQDCA